MNDPLPRRDGWGNPIVWIAFTIILGIFALILFAMLEIDHGFVSRLGTPNFARGLITYLFAVTTIGTAVGLVVACLTGFSGVDAKDAEEKFRRGKDVLGLLLGVFGTIVGFYFGTASDNTASMLAVTRPILSAPELAPGETVTLTAAVAGGAPPYRYAIATGNEAFADFERVQDNAVVIVPLSADRFPSAGMQEIRLRVVDSIGAAQDASVDISVLGASP